jgi:hypothetical protein
MITLAVAPAEAHAAAVVPESNVVDGPEIVVLFTFTCV